MLSVFHSPADHDKVLKLSLRNYFELFFRDTLSGILFSELIAAVDPYLRALAKDDQPDAPSEPDSEFAGILTKQELLGRLREL